MASRTVDTADVPAVVMGNTFAILNDVHTDQEDDRTFEDRKFQSMNERILQRTYEILLQSGAVQSEIEGKNGKFHGQA